MSYAVSAASWPTAVEREVPCCSLSCFEGEGPVGMDTLRGGNETYKEKKRLQHKKIIITL